MLRRWQRRLQEGSAPPAKPSPNRIRLADVTCIPIGEGWPYLATLLDLATRKIAGWVSRTGNCNDNAPMESIFHTLKVELAHQRRRATRAKARQALSAYIEGYCNRHRIQRATGYLTPEQAGQRMIG